MKKKSKMSFKVRIKNYINTYNFIGIITGTIFTILSFGPSLLPRSWYMQAVVSGVVFVIGYGLGVFISYILRQFKSPNLKNINVKLIKNVSYGLLLVSYIVAMALGYRWQEEAHELMNMDIAPAYSMLGITLLTILVIIVLIFIARIIRAFFHWLNKQILKIMPVKIATSLAVVLTIFVVVGLVEGFILDGAYAIISNSFSARNNTTDQGIERQNIPTVSGSDASLITWDSLGKQGRKFIGQIASDQELQSFSNENPSKPVRIYAGLESAEDVKQRATLAAADLIRAGGFNKEIVVVVTTTGTGWVDEQGVDPIEYMYNGNSAIIGMQYSYLPSWISFLVDQQKAKDAGIELYNAVYKEWSKLPENNRPKLVAFGESLGAFGSEANFPALSSAQAMTQGALWVGPPNSTALWGNLIKNRDQSSTMINPIVERGETVRFAATAKDLTAPSSVWNNPRIVYLQHASDPIVWWTPNAIFNKPDWYNEPRGYDVSVATRWFPVITFWQLTADMAFANSVPDGHGHKYGTLPVDAWAQIAPPQNWTTAKTTDLKTLLSK